MYSTAFVSLRLLHFRFRIPEYSGSISSHWLSVKSVGYGLRPAFTSFMLLLYHVLLMKTSSHFPQQIEQYKGYIAGYQQDLATLASHPLPPENFVGMEVMGKCYADKEAAGDAIISACKEAVKTNAETDVGEYRGLRMTISYNPFDASFEMSLRGAMSHKLTLGSDARGNLIRIENALNAIPDRMSAA